MAGRENATGSTRASVNVLAVGHSAGRARRILHDLQSSSTSSRPVSRPAGSAPPVVGSSPTMVKICTNLLIVGSGLALQDSQKKSNRFVSAASMELFAVNFSFHVLLWRLA
ncbi:hypothetical protein E2562_030457 [Oryza meyeriana var. granulata]|uniref:Uncharacterized protein n=1 Tax=Oryza meyeriana var. granulata TaxID=110450 RepID=A0A6G1CJR6_9ORYZ|nr:hypothetical protein E2562_030457 [Oryza meyeriana var. granulata]